MRTQQTTYRRGATVTRGGTTFQRRGGAVRYQPARGGAGVEVLTWVGLGFSKLLGLAAEGVVELSRMPGRSKRLEADRRMLELVMERTQLRQELARIPAEDGDEEARMVLRRRIHEIDVAWSEQNRKLA